MKNFFRIFILTIFIIIVTVMCFFTYKHFADQEGSYFLSENDEKYKENEKNKQLSKETLFTAENFPRIDASLATQPLTDAFMKNFVGEDFAENYEYTNTHPAYTRLVDGDVDLIVVTEPSEEELQYASSKGIELNVTPVVKEGFVFYVNSENSVKNLSLAQIQDIYAGKITNWKDVGGNSEEIRAFQRPKNSGSQTGMISLVMKDKQLMEPLKNDIIETMESIINMVASYDNGKNAIGYSYYYYATTMFDTIDSTVSNKIKFLSIDGVSPNNNTIKSGEYPLTTSYYIVTRKIDQNSNVKKLINAMLSERGQAVAEEAGYVGIK